MPNIDTKQREICNRFGVTHTPCDKYMKIHISSGLDSQSGSLNGLRTSPYGVNTGWYIWEGDNLSADPDTFTQLYVEQAIEMRPDIKRYLGLPPGWRFLASGEFEEIWKDEHLLEP